MVHNRNKLIWLLTSCHPKGAMQIGGSEAHAAARLLGADRLTSAERAVIEAAKAWAALPDDTGMEEAHALCDALLVAVRDLKAHEADRV